MSDVDNIIAREGGFVNDPADRGGATKYGITRATLAWHRGYHVTVEDVKNLTVQEATEIYEKRFIYGPKFNLIKEIDKSGQMLYSNMVDFGVMSGPHLAITHLQEILQVTADGVLGPVTLEALSKASHVSVNKQLVIRRALMAARLAKRDPNQLRFLAGWLTRFFQFL